MFRATVQLVFLAIPAILACKSRCKEIQKENKHHVSDAVHHFSEATLKMANEVVTSIETARNLVEHVKPDLLAMVTSLKISKDETSRAEKEARNATLETSATIAKTRNVIKKTEIELEKLKMEKTNNQNMLNTHQNHISSYHSYIRLD